MVDGVLEHSPADDLVTQKDAEVVPDDHTLQSLHVVDDHLLRQRRHIINNVVVVVVVIRTPRQQTGTRFIVIVIVCRCLPARRYYSLR